MNKKERLKRALQFHVVDFSLSGGDEYDFSKPNTGIAFTIPVEGLAF